MQPYHPQVEHLLQDTPSFVLFEICFYNPFIQSKFDFKKENKNERISFCFMQRLITILETVSYDGTQLV